MTNNTWLDLHSPEELMDLFYCTFFALDGIHDSFNFPFNESDWKAFSDSFDNHFRPIYGSMVADERAAAWYDAEMATFVAMGAQQDERM